MEDNFTLTDYIDYFRKLAVLHTDIQHSSATRKFYRFNIDEIGSSLRLKIGYPCLLLESYETQRRGSTQGNPQEDKLGAFMILDKVKSGDYDHEEEVLVKTMEIGDDIIAQMCEDAEKDILYGFDPDSVHTNKVGPIWDNLFGTLYTFTITTPKTTARNADKWITE